MTDRKETLGPAETVVQALLTHADHLVHNRPGMIVTAPGTPIGVRWSPVQVVAEGGAKVVYRLDKVKKKSVKTRVGVLGEDGQIRGATVVGTYRAPGLFPEVAGYLWDQVASVWRLDNEFVARWASWSFPKEHKDLKVVLAAFLLVQPRWGAPVTEGEEVLFHDDDLRDVGEAMCLLRRKDGRDLSPKLLLRVGDLLRLPVIADKNRQLGFARSGRHPALGRWPRVVEKWLRHREANPGALEGLVKAGYRTTVMQLARRIGYKPESARFFELLRWKQKQAADGRRAIAIGAEVAAAESWKGLGEAAICERIVATRPGWKRLVGLVPAEIGLTRAIVAAAIEAGSLSDLDLVILAPTLEDLGLLDVPAIRARWEAATQGVSDQRAAHIAERMKRKENVAVLEEAADAALQKAVVEVVKGLRIYVIVDISGSMAAAIENAKTYLAKFVQAFPLSQLHVSVFNTTGREVTIKHASAAGVAHAFSPYTAGGGTDYGAGVAVLAHHRPAADEDVLFVFIGDQQASRFTDAVRKSALNPVAFAMLQVGQNGLCVEQTASELGIPIFTLEEAIFADPYAVPRTLQRLIASTPVVAAARRTALIDEILSTDLLKKPVWA